MSLDRSNQARRFATSPISVRSNGRSIFAPSLVFKSNRTGAGTAASRRRSAANRERPATRTLGLVRFSRDDALAASREPFPRPLPLEAPDPNASPRTTVLSGDHGVIASASAAARMATKHPGTINAESVSRSGHVYEGLA